MTAARDKQKAGKVRKKLHEEENAHVERGNFYYPAIGV
jgi:hypothetical protein